MKVIASIRSYVKKNRNAVLAIVVLVGFFLVYAVASSFFLVKYVNVSAENEIATTSQAASSTEKKIIVTHMKTPIPVKAVYMSACFAGSRELREKVASLAKDTEINSIVIDVKDYTGKISFLPDNPEWAEYLSERCRAGDMKEFLASLHERGIYTIARITTFQDPFYAKKNPAVAVKLSSNTSILWKDKKGINYLDPGARQAWEHIAKLAEESYAVGFDEINFDYIRFPSDGNMKDIYFPYSNGKAKVDVMRSFYEYIHDRFASTSIVTSADLFGMVTTNKDDLGIGQNLEDALRNFDYVVPMVYPSHYPATWNGFKKPAEHPYEVVKIAMSRAVERAITASTSPLKLRSWIQDFNLGAVYTPEMVRAQFRATYDSGLDSWMIWDPANTYTKEALLKK